MRLFTPVSSSDAAAMEVGQRVRGPLFWQTMLVPDEAESGAVWVTAEVEEAVVD